MVNCSVRQCGARRSVNQPLLKFHRFPKNDGLRRKWIEIIGTENINLRHKELYICSLHFEESSYNRTLEVTRLRDGAVPSLHLGPQERDAFLCQMYDIESASATPASQNTVHLEKACEIPSTSRDTHFQTSTTSVQPLVKKNLELPSKKVQDQTKKLAKMTKLCDEQRKKIKRLYAKIRRQGGKITNLQEAIFDLKRKNLINTEQCILHEV